MNTIKQTVAVKNHQITIDLPEDFEAEMVEVLIIPKEEGDYYVSKSEKALIINRVKTSKVEDAKIREHKTKTIKKFSGSTAFHRL